MILIIGAEASGKREFAKSLGYSDDDFTTDPFDGKRVVYGVQSILLPTIRARRNYMMRLRIRRLLSATRSAAA